MFAVLALINAYCSVLLLLFLLIRTRAIYNLVAALGRVAGHALLVLLMSILTTYGGSLLIFLHMNGKMVWNGELPCDTLRKCVTYGVFKGITGPGGIGDLMMIPTWYQQEGTYVMLFNVFFFMVVVLIQQAIIVALVSKSFSELRCQNEKTSRLEHFKCFICGQDRKQFGSLKEFHDHRSHMHDPWKYMKLRIYLEEKLLRNRHELTGIESHVAKKMMLVEPEEFEESKLEVLKFMPIVARGNIIIEKAGTKRFGSIEETLGSRGLNSLIAAVEKQNETLSVMQINKS